jgi:hypothetical protein
MPSSTTTPDTIRHRILRIISFGRYTPPSEGVTATTASLSHNHNHNAPPHTTLSDHKTIPPNKKKTYQLAPFSPISSDSIDTVRINHGNQAGFSIKAFRDQNRDIYDNDTDDTVMTFESTQSDGAEQGSAAQIPHDEEAAHRPDNGLVHQEQSMLCTSCGGIWKVREVHCPAVDCAAKTLHNIPRPGKGFEFASNSNDHVDDDDESSHGFTARAMAYRNSAISWYDRYPQVPEDQTPPREESTHFQSPQVGISPEVPAAAEAVPVKEQAASSCHQESCHGCHAGPRVQRLTHCRCCADSSAHDNGARSDQHAHRCTLYYEPRTATIVFDEPLPATRPACGISSRQGRCYRVHWAGRKQYIQLDDESSMRDGKFKRLMKWFCCC